MRARTVVARLAVIVAAGVLVSPSRIEASQTSTCNGAPTAGAVVVETSRHELTLCEGSRAKESFGVRLARNGVGKRREGDKKTPLGRYALGAPNASSDYGTFVPIGYPTEAQRREGYTGSAVGVHGPDRRIKWAGALANAFDTTDGCVGIATDEEMNRLATWLRAHTSASIDIR
jgi:L,D-peptidoglycan transpeptidase YkuD (ErfK/YbiS/YcfS/YnhG family)